MARLDEDRRQASRKVTRDEISAAVGTLVAAHPEVEAVWLFGSYARGAERHTSDVDLAVMTAPGRSRDFAHRAALRGEAEAALGVPVDVVLLHAHLDRALLWEALCRPVLLYARDPQDAGAFASWLRSLVRDEWPRLERRWKRALEWAEEVRRATSR